MQRQYQRENPYYTDVINMPGEIKNLYQKLRRGEGTNIQN